MNFNFLKGKESRAGLYIDGQGVHLMQVGRSGGRLKVLSSAYAPLNFPPDVVAESKAKIIRESIVQVFKSATIQTRDVYLALAGEDSLMRCFELPLLPKREQRNAIRFEAQKYVPFEIRDLYFDYEVFPDEAHKRMKIALSAAKKSTIEALAAPLHAEGLRIIGTELVSHAIIRSYSSIASTKALMTAVVCVNENRTADLVIFKGHSVYSHRHMALAQLANSEDLDTNYVLSEMRLCFDSFAKTFKAEPVEKICLFAGRMTDKLAALGEVLRQEFNVPVEQQRPTALQGVRSAEESSGTIVSFGLASRDFVSNADNNLNLYSSGGVGMKEEAPLTAEELKKKTQATIVRYALLGIGVLGLLAVFQFNRLTWEKNGVKRLIASYPKSTQAEAQITIDELTAKNDEFAMKAATSATLIEQRVFMTIKLNELVKSVPENMVLTRVTYSDTTFKDGTGAPTIKIEGYLTSLDPAGDLVTINKMISALSASKDFMKGIAEVKISSAKKGVVRMRPTVIFSVDCLPRKSGV